MRHRISVVRGSVLSGLAVVIAAAGLMAIPTSSAWAGTLQCFPSVGGAKVGASASPATVSVADSRTGSPVGLIVTITATTFTITPLDSSVTLTDALWCVKASTKTNSGSGVSGASTATNKRGVVQDISSVTIYSVTTSPPGLHLSAGLLLAAVPPTCSMSGQRTHGSTLT